MLAGAKRPLIVAGSGIVKAGGTEELIKFAELLGAPVVMEPRYSFLSFPTDHPQSFQIAERNPAFDLPVWGEPDVILAIGCRLIREYRYLPEPVIKPDTRCIHIEEDPWEIGKVFPVDLGIIADGKSALRGLLEVYPKIAGSANGREERLATIKQAQEQVKAELEARVKQGWDGKPISAARLARTLDRLLEKDALVVNESPTSKDILMANFKFSQGRSYFSNSSGGYLGWGLGAAIGAKLAAPNRRVVACLGDGSSMFGLQGLWTLAKYRVPLIVLFSTTALTWRSRINFAARRKEFAWRRIWAPNWSARKSTSRAWRTRSASMASGSKSRTLSSRRSSVRWNRMDRRSSMS